MDADGRIDAALNKVLRAAGTRLRNYMPLTQDELRKAMREVMSDEYIAWSNACEAASEYARLHAPSNYCSAAKNDVAPPPNPAPNAMNDLDTLRPEVHTAMEAMDADVQTLEWLCIRAELLRLADENKRMRGIIETLDIEGHRRAETAEAELAALKERIFQGIVLDVDDLARGHAGLPSEWRGKRVRLVVEE